MAIEFNFKEVEEPVWTDDPWYDLTDGGYIRPEELLIDEEQIKKVQESVDILSAFLQQAYEKGVIEEA